MRYVWVIEDEKYGLQLVCATKKVADREIKKDRYHPSGYGSIVRKVAVRS